LFFNRLGYGMGCVIVFVKTISMFRNYCITAWRNLVRNKRFGLINISGLAIGITSSILIFVVVHYELSYDRFQPGYQNIYQAAMEDKFSDGTNYTPGTPFPALEALKARFPQMVTGVLYSNFGAQLTVIDSDGTPSKEKRFIEDNGIFFADANLFKVFKTGWLYGSPAVLDQPNKIVLSQKMAEKYFGQWTQAPGKYIRMDNLNTLLVAGIIQNPPGNSDFQFRAVAAYPVIKSNAYYPYSRDWGNTSSNEQLYVLLSAGESVSAINRSLEKFSRDQFPHGNRGRKRTIFLRPLSGLHFDTRMENMGDHVTNKSTLWTLSLIAGFILIMACINFVNLSTVQAVNRSKEIGVRKVLGSSRWNLLGQILGETSFIVLASILLAIGLTQVCLPYIKHIASINETVSLFHWQTGAYLLGVFVTITLLAGLYPAYIASGFSPILALKNKINSASVGGISLRRTLVVIQFAISQVLIAGTLIAVSQMNFVQNADLGMHKEGILVVRGNGDSVQISRMKSFKEELMKNKSVEDISLCSDVPSSDNNSTTDFSFDHKAPETFNVFYKFGDRNYCKTFGIQLSAGRLPEQTDTVKDLLINETLVSKLGLKSPEEALGKDLNFGGTWKKVVGVVKDFRTNSLRESTKPLMIACDKSQYGYTALRVKATDLESFRAFVQQVWDKFYPEYANQTFFLDQRIEEFYTQEQQLALLYKIFAGIAVFISCLGLYGLVSFMAVQRRKEVGIRKVLGASIAQIIYLFSKEFTVLILISFGIAVPVAWLMMNDWLQHFVYRIPIHPLLFVESIGISVFIAWLTVGYKSFRAAGMNPAKSLKSE
jgi:putative ABC transport system permease protein